MQSMRLTSSWRSWAWPGGAVGGCDSLRQEAGLTKQSPDEFAVTTKAPLIIPPDFNLRPPSPGAAPLNQTRSHHHRPKWRCSTAADPADRGGAACGQLFARREDAVGQCRGRRMPIPRIRAQLNPTSGSHAGCRSAASPIAS